MNRRKVLGLLIGAACSATGATSSSASGQSLRTVRAGYFPNITHSQALVGIAGGWFEKAMSPGMGIEWKAFNAGPDSMEALLAGAIDLVYVGPNPAVSAYVRSQGEALKVIAGATSGGAALVVRGDSRIQRPEDFHGKRIASPQLGNTQDVSLRTWLRKQGLKTRDKGGDVQVIPVPNPEQITLFYRKEIDAAWAPEPWASRLIHEAAGRLLLDERELWPGGQFVTAHLAVRTAFLDERREVVKKWLRAHVETTEWINAHLPQARTFVNEQIRVRTGKALLAGVLEDAFSRIQVTYDPVRSSLLVSTQSAFEAGFLGRVKPDISGIYDLRLLNEILVEKGRKPVE